VCVGACLRVHNHMNSTLFKNEIAWEQEIYCYSKHGFPYAFQYSRTDILRQKDIFWCVVNQETFDPFSATYILEILARPHMSHAI
jgi:hypothetical protein